MLFQCRLFVVWFCTGTQHTTINYLPKKVFILIMPHSKRWCIIILGIFAVYNFSQFCVFDCLWCVVHLLGKQVDEQYVTWSSWQCLTNMYMWQILVYQYLLGSNNGKVYVAKPGKYGNFPWKLLYVVRGLKLSYWDNSSMCQTLQV